MGKRVSASDAKNNFGGLLDEVAALGRVDIVKHGRLVAIVLSPRAFDASPISVREASHKKSRWGENHMIAPKQARRARMLSRPSIFDEE